MSLKLPTDFRGRWLCWHNPTVLRSELFPKPGTHSSAGTGHILVCVYHFLFNRSWSNDQLLLNGHAEQPAFDQCSQPMTGWQVYHIHSCKQIELLCHIYRRLWYILWVNLSTCYVLLLCFRLCNDKPGFEVSGEEGLKPVRTSAAGILAGGSIDVESHWYANVPSELHHPKHSFTYVILINLIKQILEFIEKSIKSTLTYTFCKYYFTFVPVVGTSPTAPMYVLPIVLIFSMSL